jgi:hypothetical protein
MDNDSPNRVSKQLSCALQLSTKHMTLRARLSKLPRWKRFAGCGLALVVCLAVTGMIGNALLRPSGVPLSVQQTATAELLAKTGRPELGASVTRFIDVYGQPSSSSSPSDGLYDFNNILEVFTSHANDRVNAASFLNSDGTGWASLKRALPDCEKLIPSDAIYQRVVELYNPANGLHVGTERVYFSPSLASLFPSNDFTDEYKQVSTSGTFAIVFHYAVLNSPGMASIAQSTATEELSLRKNSLKQTNISQRVSSDIPTRIADCNPQIGLELVQKP